jgi:hypothetical protein
MKINTSSNSSTPYYSINPNGIMSSHPGDVSNASINQGSKPMNHMNLSLQPVTYPEGGLWESIPLRKI